MKRLRSELGFTIIEVMVAITLLLVGVLGSVTLVDQANKTTTATKARDAATNVARQLIDDARDVDYSSLIGSGPSDPLAVAFKTLPGLSDANTGTTTWELVRRNITFTVEATSCIIDDPHDGSRTDNSLAGLCPDSLQPPTPATPTTDPNPDDFRRVQVQIWWDLRGRTHNCATGLACVTQTGLVANPQIGPRVTNVATNPASPVESSSADHVDFTVTTTQSDSMNWSVDDGNSTGQAADAGGGTSWTFTWSFNPSCAAPGLSDGAYTVALQGIYRALPGHLTPSQITINRCLPRAPTGLQGGLNTRDVRVDGTGVGLPNGIVDLLWNTNPERDIVGYRVFRVVGTPDVNIGTGSEPGADTPDQLVGSFLNPVTGHTYPGCGPGVDGVSSPNCFDPTPGATPPSYYVVALDRPSAADAGNSSSPAVDCPAYFNSANTISAGTFSPGQKFTLRIDATDPTRIDRYGCPSAILGPTTTPALGNSASRPTFGATPTLAAQPSSDSQQINFNWASPPASIQFFRIYLDGTDYTDRIGRTSDRTAASFVDQNAGNYTPGTHRYWVTAVDSNFQESDPVPGAGISFTVS